jgi:hypothetical protein
MSLCSNFIVFDPGEEEEEVERERERERESSHLPSATLMKQVYRFQMTLKH